MEVRTKKLGLAAYIKMHGIRLVGFRNGQFVFDTSDSDFSTRSVDVWETEYLNSCCHRHDTELVNLRNLMR